MKRTFLSFASILVLLAVAGCIKRPELVNDKNYAIQLLNERLYEEAIVILKSLNEQPVRDDEVTLLLASAYAGSVGLDVVEGLGAFKPFLYQTDTKIVLPTPARLPDIKINKDLLKDEAYAKKVAKEIVRFTTNLKGGFAVFFALPYTLKLIVRA